MTTLLLVFMITVTTNIADVLLPMAAKIEALNPGGPLYGDVLRTVTTSMLGVVRTRIHEDGKAADGTDIGVYSPKYKAVREKAGRPTDKMNFSFTGQLNNQLTILATQNGGYGLGWPNDEMFRRAGYLEQKVGKKVWALTEEEVTQATAVAQNVVSRALSE